MENLLQDLRYSARKLLLAPGFTVVAITTLALAIGATTAIFSIVNGVLLRPMPISNPDRVVFVGSENRDGKLNPMSTLDFIDYRDQSKSFSAMAAIDRAPLNVTGEDAAPERLNGAAVGASFFTVLGVTPALGRAFRDGEDRRGAAHVTVLSDRLWRNRYGADPQIIGQHIRLDGSQFQVVGVASPTLNVPSDVDIYVPFVFEPYQVDPANRGAHSHFAVARLRDGVSLEAAQNDLRAVANRLETTFPESNTGFSARVLLLRDQVIGNVDKPLYLMLGAVVLVLMIACANVANLLLVRAADRETEMAVRTALGAGRGQIIRQLVTESVLLSIAGAAIGTALAAWAVAGVVAFGPAGVPRLRDVTVDLPVLGFALGVSALTGVIFGLVPALHASRPNLAGMLREGSRGSSRGAAHRTRSALVVAEMSLAVVLLVGAGLLIRSFVKLTNVDPGFKPDRVVAFNVTLPSTKYRYERDVRALATDVTGRLRSLPGTRDVAVTFGRPLANDGMIRTTFEINGWAPSTPNSRRVAEVHMTSPGFFNTLGIPLIRGRLFTPADDRTDVPPVIVVTQEFAKKYFPNEDPIGRFAKFGITHDTAETGKGEAQVQGEIIGIVGDVKQRDLATPAYPAVYAPFNTFAIGFFSVLVRTDADWRVLAGRIPEVVREVDRDLPVYGLTTMRRAVADSVAQPRFYMLLLVAFAGLALLLAAIGIYGIISYAVSQRTRELGIRVALGATRRTIVREVVGRGLWLAGAGIAVGAIASLALTRAMQSLTFGIERLDPIAFAAAPVTLLAAAILGCYLPARRASTVDPVIAMRSD